MPDLCQAGEESTNSRDLVMTYDEIRKMPRCINKIPVGSHGVHESCTRGYQILQKVIWLLEQKCSPEAVLELIRMMDSNQDD